MAIFILYHMIDYNYIKKSQKLYCIFLLRMTSVVSEDSITHTGVSVVEVAGCCKDCWRESSDWLLTNPLPWPLTVSPLVTGGCCWVKAAFNLWNANTALKNGSCVTCKPNSQHILRLTKKTVLVEEHINTFDSKFVFICLISLGIITITMAN